MASLQTKIAIWNAALDLLREQPIASVDDRTPAAKWLGRNYDQQRDYLMERYLWKFAVERVELAADPTAPTWGWAFRYLIPTGALRIIPPTFDGSWNGRPIPFEQESGYLLCDVPGPLRLRYINRLTNEGLFSNGYCEVLSIRLAMRMAHWMTGKQSMAAELTQLYTVTLNEVKQTEAVQVAQDSYYDSDILTERASY
jgi:hypothetical protein